MSGGTLLSNRQQQCLWLASKGKTSKESALILGVSERTVNFHLHHAFDKLNVRNKQAAVARALSLNLLDHNRLYLLNSHRIQKRPSSFTRERALRPKGSNLDQPITNHQNPTQ